ncbi:hypothetical protein LCGC14_2114350 [marine sediment metagenome]|uniref:Uncharacterized protein n=1 Tax=marine sediment metagenome TaxID=412755 RepID=A0A0F9E697_9ZZZZ
MSKFKVGNEVRIVRNDGHHWGMEQCLNKIGVITTVIPRYYIDTNEDAYLIDKNKYYINFTNDMLKLVGKKNPNNNIVIRE